MHFTNLVIAAFIGIAQLVSAAPVDLEARTKQPAYVVPVVANNGLLVGSGNGGKGGLNIAKPLAFANSDSTVKNKGWGGKVIVDTTASNEVLQDASGGDGSAVGSYGSNNHFKRLDEREAHNAPPKVVVPVISSNGLLLNSGNGGNGGKNIAKPVASADSDSWVFTKGGKVAIDTSAGNTVAQSAAGGDGSAVGTYGTNNHFSRDLEDREPHNKQPQPAKPVLLPISNNAILVGSGNGGNGGKNVAVPVAIALSGQTVKGSKGDVSIGTGAGNIVSQDASGGDGSAVGTYGSDNHF